MWWGVAVVLAQTLAAALEAAEAVKVDYEVLPAVFHSEAALIRARRSLSI
jgi:CO/xanthine dehydrogenase Mo-binding subunit